jgi:ATP-binding cassette, subfamily C (CFTR/MRP), member 1
MRVEDVQYTLLNGKASPANRLFVKDYPPLCSDSEGWGPISPIRYDFTPCFLDVWIISVAAWGLVGGAAAVWFLLKKRVPQEVSKNWHFYAKLVSHTA